MFKFRTKAISCKSNLPIVIFPSFSKILLKQDNHIQLVFKTRVLPKYNFGKLEVVSSIVTLDFYCHSFLFPQCFSIYPLHSVNFFFNIFFNEVRNVLKSVQKYKESAIHLTQCNENVQKATLNQYLFSKICFRGRILCFINCI